LVLRMPTTTEINGMGSSAPKGSDLGFLILRMKTTSTRPGSEEGSLRQNPTLLHLFRRGRRDDANDPLGMAQRPS
jgi:hypothetical protein